MRIRLSGSWLRKGHKRIRVALHIALSAPDGEVRLLSYLRPTKTVVKSVVGISVDYANTFLVHKPPTHDELWLGCGQHSRQWQMEQNAVVGACFGAISETAAMPLKKWQVHTPAFMQHASHPLCHLPVPEALFSYCEAYQQHISLMWQTIVQPSKM